ncbi:MAG: hypothetical protein ACRBN8_28785 [Nannocystales bacterium]
MAARLASFVVATALWAGGCGFFMEPKPDLENKKTAEIGNFSVEYPGNWETEFESEDLDGVKFSSLTIESAGNAIAVIQVFEPGVELGPDEVFEMYAEGMVEASKTEFGGVVGVSVHSKKDFTRGVLGTTWVGRTGTVDVKLLGEKVPNRIQTLQHHSEQRTVVVVVQAPTEDWKTANHGFDAIYDGLKEAEG